MGRLLKPLTDVSEGSVAKPAEKEKEAEVTASVPAVITAPADDVGHPSHGAKYGTAEIGGHETEILVQPFDDCVLVTVTQNKRMGTMVDTVVGGTDSFSVNVLMGKRDEQVLELLARRVLGNMVESQCRKRLLMSVALRRHSYVDLQPLVDAVLANKVW